MPTSSAPSSLRTAPLVGRARPFSARSLAVIAALAAGKSRLEAARENGIDKANVRVIELRAHRRGMLGGTPRPAVIEPSPSDAAIRLALAAFPDDKNNAIAKRLGANQVRVARVRASMGLPPSKRGQRGGGAGLFPDRDAAIVRLVRVEKKTMREVAVLVDLSHQRVSMIVARAAARST